MNFVIHSTQSIPKLLSSEHLSSPSRDAALPERQTACLWGKERCLLDSTNDPGLLMEWRSAFV